MTPRMFTDPIKLSLVSRCSLQSRAVATQQKDQWFGLPAAPSSTCKSVLKQDTEDIGCPQWAGHLCLRNSKQRKGDRKQQDIVAQLDLQLERKREFVVPRHIIIETAG